MAASDQHGQGLRHGWTTGACAAAAARAALRALLSGEGPAEIDIVLPRGRAPRFAVHRCAVEGPTATASVIKDAGDDPDVTHGAEIVVSLTRLYPDAGVVYRAGEGVGTVTRPGLPIPPGEPAINPGPRAQIETNLTLEAVAHDTFPDAEVTVSIPGGAALAERTLNGRLGIVGGLSILGTTGVVVPYSCSAWIHSIQRGVDVARACDIHHIGACTGRTSEAALRRRTGLPEEAMIDMGDFAGALFKYLRRHPVDKLTLGGGFAKLAKLAQGAMDLHSSRSRLDMDKLAELVGRLGGVPETVSAVRGADSGIRALQIAQGAGLRLGDAVAAQAREVALASIGGLAVEVFVYDRAGKEVGHAGP